MTELAVRNVDDLKALAQIVSVSALLPRDLRGKPADAAVIIMYGQELGLRTMQALQGIHVIEGRPSISAQTWIALARSRGHRVAVVEHTDDRCTVKVVRGDTGEEHTEAYTLEQAVQAGRVRIKDGRPYARSQSGKALNWETETRSMLLARAASRALRFACPEVALGFYSPDEALEAAENEQATTVTVEQTEPAVEVVEPEVVQAEISNLAGEFDFGHAEEATPGE